MWTTILTKFFMNSIFISGFKFFFIFSCDQAALRTLLSVRTSIRLRPSVTPFYTPVWKTGRIMPWQCPSVRLSVRPSVRPSIRPPFPDFSSTCFEISIWNLVYAFSRWHDMSSLSCITIGSIWPSLQPKVGQTYFLQSWPHKSRYILQIWYTGGLLYTSRHKFRFL